MQRGMFSPTEVVVSAHCKGGDSARLSLPRPEGDPEAAVVTAYHDFRSTCEHWSVMIEAIEPNPHVPSGAAMYRLYPLVCVTEEAGDAGLVDVREESWKPE